VKHLLELQAILLLLQGILLLWLWLHLFHIL